MKYYQTFSLNILGLLEIRKSNLRRPCSIIYNKNSVLHIKRTYYKSMKATSFITQTTQQSFKFGILITQLFLLFISQNIEHATD